MSGPLVDHPLQSLVQFGDPALGMVDQGVTLFLGQMGGLAASAVANDGQKDLAVMKQSLPGYGLGMRHALLPPSMQLAQRG